MLFSNITMSGSFAQHSHALSIRCLTIVQHSPCSLCTVPLVASGRVQSLFFLVYTTCSAAPSRGGKNSFWLEVNKTVAKIQKEIKYNFVSAHIYTQGLRSGLAKTCDCSPDVYEYICMRACTHMRTQSSVCEANLMQSILKRAFQKYKLHPHTLCFPTYKLNESLSKRIN